MFLSQFFWCMTAYCILVGTQQFMHLLKMEMALPYLRNGRKPQFGSFFTNGRKTHPAYSASLFIASLVFDSR